MIFGNVELIIIFRVNTALHIVKGAIVKVLHTPITTTTDAFKKDEVLISCSQLFIFNINKSYELI
jgi:hypothetical protein